jgi:hypothetical protein
MTVTFLSLGAIMVGINPLAMCDVSYFLARHDSFNEAGLSAFKGVARWNTIAALVSIPACTGGVAGRDASVDYLHRATLVEDGSAPPATLFRRGAADTSYR